MNARKQYLKELGKEYNRADEKGRGRLLDEAEKQCDVRPALYCPPSPDTEGDKVRN